MSSSSNHRSTPRMVFVLSTGRTGTKFLATYFNATYPSVRAVHEPIPSEVLRLASNAYLSERLSRRLMIALFRSVRRRIFARLASDIYLDATGYLYGFVDVLDQLADNPTILHVVRDPRDFVRSEHNFGSMHGIRGLGAACFPFWYAPVGQVLNGDPVTSVGRAGAKWLLINRTLLAARKRYPDYHLIRFEDIFDAAHSGLRRICDILGLPFRASGPISPARKVNGSAHHRLAGWQQWTPEQCRELQAICGPLMQPLGYEWGEAWRRKVES